MRMNCDVLNAHLPYEIHWRTRDIAMKWGNWKVHGKFATPIEQRDAYYQLVSTNVIQYTMCDNEAVLKLQERATELRDQERAKSAKSDDTDIAGALNLPIGIDPASNYVCWREL